MSMTLEQVRDWLIKEGQFRIRVQGKNDHDNNLLKMADAINSHLTQPAQSVGESMVDRMILEYMRMEPDDVKIMDISTECQETREFCRSLLAAALTEKPAQSVDVRDVVLKSLGGYLERHWPDNPVSYDDMADKLTAALQEKGNG